MKRGQKMVLRNLFKRIEEQKSLSIRDFVALINEMFGAMGDDDFSYILGGIGFDLHKNGRIGIKNNLSKEYKAEIRKDLGLRSKKAERFKHMPSRCKK